MSQKKNSGRDFTIDLGDDDDDIDWGSEDDFDNMEDVHNLSLAELYDRDEVRRRDCIRREREDARRAQTQENTISNSGDCLNFSIVLLDVFMF